MSLLNYTNIDCPKYEDGRCLLAESIVKSLGGNGECPTNESACTYCLETFPNPTEKKPGTVVCSLAVANAPELMMGSNKCIAELSVKQVVKKGAASHGPGSQLLKIYSKRGWPSCQFCRDVAADMNSWGVVGCRARFDEIVESGEAMIAETLRVSTGKDIGMNLTQWRDWLQQQD